MARHRPEGQRRRLAALDQGHLPHQRDLLPAARAGASAPRRDPPGARREAGRRHVRRHATTGPAEQTAVGADHPPGPCHLRACLTQAIIDHKIAANPAGKGARVPGPGRCKPQFWGPIHLATFLAHVTRAEPRLAVAFQLAGWRGLRRGEVCGLRWSDLDLDGGTLTIVRNVTEADRAIHVGEPKTERGARVVSIGPQLVAALRAHRKAQAAERLAAGPDWTDEGWVFPGPDGRVLPPHIPTHRFKALVRELPELPDLHLHALRHTAATLMLLQGIAPKVVADQLGHSKVQMTLDTYAQVLPQQRDASADAVEALFGTSVTAL